MTSTETPTLSQALARFADGVSYAALPEAVERSIRERILDTIGLCLGAGPLDTSAMGRSVALAWGGAGEATTIGFGDRLPATGAGFVNGVLAHSLDFDDTHLPSVLHPSASVIPAALAAGEAVNASLEDIIAAAAAGYEICIRTGMAAYDRELGNSIFFERGWHATSICGTLAAAAVGAKLFGLGAHGIGHALGIACSMGSGVIEANRAGGSVKRLHCGWAVHAGLIAAQCARAGLTGPPTALEGRFGFYQAFCSGRFFADEILSGLGEEWCIPGIFYKPYPANHFTHAGIDAALADCERRCRPRARSGRCGPSESPRPRCGRSGNRATRRFVRSSGLPRAVLRAVHRSRRRSSGVGDSGWRSRGLLGRERPRPPIPCPGRARGPIVGRAGVRCDLSRISSRDQSCLTTAPRRRRSSKRSVMSRIAAGPARIRSPATNSRVKFIGQRGADDALVTAAAPLRASCSTRGASSGWGRAV